MLVKSNPVGLYGVGSTCKCCSNNGMAEADAKRASLPRPVAERPPLRAAENLIISGCGPAIAASFTNPLDTARVNMQINGEGGGALAHRNTFACMRHLWRTEGMAGLQRGLTTAYFREFIQNVPRLGLYAPLVATIRRLDGTADSGRADAFHQVHWRETRSTFPAFSPLSPPLHHHN